MGQSDESIRLNLLSRAILGATAAIGLALAVFAAPTNVGAFVRPQFRPGIELHRLSDAPGIALKRAYGREDEDCVVIAPRGGATPNRFVCR